MTPLDGVFVARGARPAPERLTSRTEARAGTWYTSAPLLHRTCRHGSIPPWYHLVPTSSQPFRLCETVPTVQYKYGARRVLLLVDSRRLLNPGQVIICLHALRCSVRIHSVQIRGAGHPRSGRLRWARARRVETLQMPTDVEQVADVTEFRRIVKGSLAAATARTPSVVEHLESWDQLSIGNVEQTRGAVLQTIKFDSPGAAADYAEIAMAGAGWVELDDSIGDVSVYRDIDLPHTSGTLLFRKGLWFCRPANGARRKYRAVDRPGRV